jgi:hypothetical protein
VTGARLARFIEEKPRWQIALVATLIVCFVVAVALGLVAGLVALVLWIIAQRAQI